MAYLLLVQAGDNRKWGSGNTRGATAMEDIRDTETGPGVPAVRYDPTGTARPFDLEPDSTRPATGTDPTAEYVRCIVDSANGINVDDAERLAGILGHPDPLNHENQEAA